jgi:uncharacterized membrane protein
MNWYFVIKFLHIVTAMMLIGGIFGRQLVRAYAKKVDDVQIFAALTQAAGRIENVMWCLSHFISPHAISSGLMGRRWRN